MGTQDVQGKHSPNWTSQSLSHSCLSQGQGQDNVNDARKRCEGHHRPSHLPLLPQASKALAPRCLVLSTSTHSTSGIHIELLVLDLIHLSMSSECLHPLVAPRCCMSSNSATAPGMVSTVRM